MYSKQKKSNISGEWGQIGIARVSEDEAKTLNDTTQHTGVKYVKMSKAEEKSYLDSLKKKEVKEK